MTEMISARFRAEVLGYETVRELPDDWTPARLRSLLGQLDVDAADSSDSDLWGLVEMGLADMDHDEAAGVVLEMVFGDDMSPGVRQNLVPDLEDEIPWDTFADITMHSRIFSALVPLQRAFPRRYGKPKAARAVVRIETTNDDAAAALATSPADLLLRIAAAGMEASSKLTRLFGEALADGPFPEAGAILWRSDVARDADGRFSVVLVSSEQWLGLLEDAPGWEATVRVEIPD